MFALWSGIALLVGVSTGWSDDAGLVGYWKLDEGSGEVAKDSTSNHNDGKLQEGPKWVDGKVGKALEFDGKDDCVDFGHPDSLNLGEKLTLEAWIKADAVPASGEPQIIGKSPEHYGMTYYTDGQVYFYISSGGNNAHTPMTTGEWHHVVGTFDGKKLCLYIDGELKQEVETQYPAIATCEWNVVSGKDPNTAGRFAGIIDEVKVYSRAVSADEVKKAFAAAK